MKRSYHGYRLNLHGYCAKQRTYQMINSDPELFCNLLLFSPITYLLRQAVY
jgi:hypothetical protein